MDRRIEIVISAMENQLSTRWNTETLAALVNLSASRLRHLFKQDTGQTLTRFLKDLRIRRAEKLLRTTFLSVKEIANGEALTSSSFAREFKKAFHVSPTAYRKRFGLDHGGTSKKAKKR